MCLGGRATPNGLRRTLPLLPLSPPSSPSSLPFPPPSRAGRPSSARPRPGHAPLARFIPEYSTRHLNTTWPVSKPTETSSPASQRQNATSSSSRRRASPLRRHPMNTTSTASTTASSSPPRRRRAPSAASPTLSRGARTVRIFVLCFFATSMLILCVIYTVVAFCELAERFSYYGATVVFVRTSHINMHHHEGLIRPFFC